MARVPGREPPAFAAVDEDGSPQPNGPVGSRVRSPRRRAIYETLHDAWANERGGRHIRWHHPHATLQNRCSPGGCAVPSAERAAKPRAFATLGDLRRTLAEWANVRCGDWQPSIVVKSCQVLKNIILKYSLVENIYLEVKENSQSYIFQDKGTPCGFETGEKPNFVRRRLTNEDIRDRTPAVPAAENETAGANAAAHPKDGRERRQPHGRRRRLAVRRDGLRG